MCHGYEKILQTLNSNLVLLHVCHYAFPLARNFSAEGRDIFLANLVHLHVLQYFFAVAKEFLAIGTRDVFPVLLRLLVFLNITRIHVFLKDFDGNVFLDEVDNKIRLNCCLKKMWVPILKWIKHLHTVTLKI